MGPHREVLTRNTRHSYFRSHEVRHPGQLIPGILVGFLFLAALDSREELKMQGKKWDFFPQHLYLLLLVTTQSVSYLELEHIYVGLMWKGQVRF